MRRVLFGLALAVLTGTAAAYDFSADSLMAHVERLSADSMEGRKVGEASERMAADYLISVFESAGLQPRGTDGWLQPFTFTRATEMGENNRLALNGTDLELMEEFRPLPHSVSGDFSFDEVVDVGYGITTEGGMHDDYKDKDVAGKAVLIRRFAPDPSTNPHVNFDRYAYLVDKIRVADEHDVGAIIFITPSSEDDTLPGMTAARVATRDFPIVWLRRAGIERLGLDIDNPELSSFAGTVDLVRKRDTGFNVVAYLPGQSPKTTVIGAHYDHLGYGGHGSRYMGEEPLIHNGADDNGSGTAGLLELARYFAAQPNRYHSLLFIGFSGEESGLIGSNWYVRNPTVDQRFWRLMVNMDMIGHLRNETHGLAIFGIGSAEEFEPFFADYDAGGIDLRFKNDGIGPSDHTSFYNAGTPVLHFFTGAHEYYHKPSDDASLINAEGMATVVNIVADVATNFDDKHTGLTFQKVQSSSPPGGGMGSFSVTLGVMPDYVAEVNGMRIDGVSGGRPAERAGILAGDILIAMGELPVGDIYEYMAALRKFRKGDSTPVTLVRGTDTLTVTVEFK